MCPVEAPEVLRISSVESLTILYETVFTPIFAATTSVNPEPVTCIMVLDPEQTALGLNPVMEVV